MKKLRGLWREAFGDTERYMDFYFQTKADRSSVFADFEGEELASMAFFTPYEGYYKGEKRTLEYIVGVATAEKYRHNHRMKRLLEKAISERRENGVDIVFLSPENPEVYKSLGFVPTYDRMTTTALGQGEQRYQILLWEELQDCQKKKVSDWAEKRLKAECFDLYLNHSPAYYDEVDKELHALEGELVTFWQEQEPAAVCHVIREEEVPEVTELILRRKNTEDVLQTLLYYLKTGRVDVEDSYFIAPSNKAWVVQTPQKKPMIMYRFTDEREAEPIRCYINDIT